MNVSSLLLTLWDTEILQLMNVSGLLLTQSVGYRNTSADGCFQFAADCGIQKHFSWWMFSVYCWLYGIQKHFSWWMFPVYCWFFLWNTETLQLMDVSGLLLMKCLWGTETSENSLMKITYSSSLFHMTNNVPSCLPHCYLRSCVLGSSWQMLPTKVTYTDCCSHCHGYTVRDTGSVRYSITPAAFVTV